MLLNLYRLILRHFIFIMMIVFFIACRTEQKEHSSSAEPKGNPVKTYTPPPGYESSGVDPLAALYGGKVSKKGGAKVDDAKLKTRFEEKESITFTTEFPRKWRSALSQLNKTIPTKVTSWSLSKRTRMETGKRDQVIEVNFSLLGKRKQVTTLPIKVLSSIPQLTKLPRKLGDQHEHSYESPTEKLVMTYQATKSTEQLTNPLILANISIHWEKNTVNPKNADGKNCRYVHGLPPHIASNHVPWAEQRFKSTGTRRFVAWSISKKIKKTEWQSTWIYRNGSYRDKAVGWWTKTLNRQKAVQTSFSGMEQSWSLKNGGEVSWWPETNPGPMGCKIAGPLLTISGTIPN